MPLDARHADVRRAPRRGRSFCSQLHRLVAVARLAHHSQGCQTTRSCESRCALQSWSSAITRMGRTPAAPEAPATGASANWILTHVVLRLRSFQRMLARTQNPYSCGASPPQTSRPARACSAMPGHAVARAIGRLRKRSVLLGAGCRAAWPTLSSATSNVAAPSSTRTQRRAVRLARFTSFAHASRATVNSAYVDARRHLRGQPTSASRQGRTAQIDPARPPGSYPPPGMVSPRRRRGAARLIMERMSSSALFAVVRRCDTASFAIWGQVTGALRPPPADKTPTASALVMSRHSRAMRTRSPPRAALLPRVARHSAARCPLCT